MGAHGQGAKSLELKLLTLPPGGRRDLGRHFSRENEQRLTGEADALDGRKLAPPRHSLARFGRLDGGQRQALGRYALETGLATATLHQMLQQGDQGAMLLRGDVIGLARHEQQLVDARGKQAAPPAALAIGKALHDAGDGLLHVVKTLGPGVEGLQAVHQHDLAIEAGKMLLIKPLHQMLLVLLESAFEGEIQAIIPQCSRGGTPNPGHKLQHGSALIFARQHEAARLDKVQAKLTLAGMQVSGVTLGETGDLPFIKSPIRLPGLALLGQLPGGGQGVQGGAFELLAHLLAPLLVALLKQRQVQQPLPRVIHQVQIEGRYLPQVATQRVAGAITQLEAYLGHATGRLRPGGGLGKEAAQPPLISKGRDMQILLGHAARPQQTPLPGGIPEGQAAIDGGMLELMDQGGDEGGLAAARQAGHRQTQVPVTDPIHRVLGLVLQGRELSLQSAYQSLLNSRCRVNSLEVTSFSICCTLGSRAASSRLTLSRACSGVMPACQLWAFIRLVAGMGESGVNSTGFLSSRNQAAI